MNDVFTNLALAAHYKRRAVASLLPPKVVGHLAVIERELRAMAVELISDAPTPDASAPAPSGAKSRKIDVEGE